MYHPNGCFISNIKKIYGRTFKYMYMQNKTDNYRNIFGSIYLESYFILYLKNNSCFENKNGAAMSLPFSDIT